MALGPYDLLVPVGTGGMARVWAARVRATGQLIALKMMLPDLVENLSFRQMFFDEGRIASRVSHPNVCKTFELSQIGEVLLLAMEWVDGPSLMRVLRPGPDDGSYAPRVAIPHRLAARIVADACAGLHAAHDLVGDDGRHLGVVHRDVSPHNLLVDHDGAVKVTDFGVAKAIGKAHMTVAGQLKGKLAYMSPEQLTAGIVDRKSDVFGLGCVLYEITTAQKPFTGEHDPQVMASIVMGNYELPSSVFAGYPPALEAIVMKALANDAAERYPTAEHLRLALEEWLRTTGPPVLPSHVARLVRERCGADLDERAHALATAVPPSHPADTGSGAMEIDRHARPDALERRGSTGIIAAALVGAVLGVGVLSYVRSLKRSRAPQVVTAVTTAAQATELLPPIVKAAPPEAAERAAAAPAAAPVVRLHVTPPSAVLVVDGVVMPRGTEAIARPPEDGSMEVLIRADKHEDAVVVVDGATPDEVEVELTPVKARPVRAPLPEPTDARPEAALPRPQPIEPPPIVETPPNPYD
jgi:eukaryotic-like serine/threonine-protein kinase